MYVEFEKRLVEGTIVQVRAPALASPAHRAQMPGTDMVEQKVGQRRAAHAIAHQAYISHFSVIYHAHVKATPRRA
jgi:hypothetical protein